LTQQNNQKQLQWMQQEWALEDQQRLIERQSETISLQMQITIQEKSHQAQQEVMNLSNAIDIANRALQNFVTTMGTVPSGSGNTEVNNKLGMYDGGMVPNGPLPSYFPGGYTGSGLPSAPVPAILHGSEYVIPHQGVPVLRGDNQESVSVLKEMLKELINIRELGPGRV